MKTVIMAGGKGTRISGLFPDIPKPLIPIDHVPVLEREIRLLVSQGFTDIILTVSYLHEKIEEHLGNGSRLGARIEYFIEDTPLGNAGALFRLRPKLTEPFLLLNADTVFHVDFNRMVRFHMSHGGLVTLFTHPSSHPYDSGLIVANERGQVEKWLAKEDDRPVYYKNRVNAGLHVIDPSLLDMADAGTDGKDAADGDIRIDLDRQLLKPLQGTGKMYCYDSPEYVKDMGTPERYHSVLKDFESGMMEAKNLTRKQKAVFLDRDGTINKYVGFLREIGQFELIPGIPEAVRRINESGYLAIVITNQPVVARGEVSVSRLDEIHNKMETLLGREGAYIDALYYCPHHPDSGYEGEIPELKFDCGCRKPKPGMLLKAAEDFNIDLSRSFMVGDSESDIRAGIAAGCRCVLVEGGDAPADYGQDDTLDSVLAFTKKYL